MWMAITIQGAHHRSASAMGDGDMANRIMAVDVIDILAVDRFDLRA
jgi:hypothetical protein